jgi:Tol biopolymer transport system component
MIAALLAYVVARGSSMPTVDKTGSVTEKLAVTPVPSPAAPPVSTTERTAAALHPADANRADRQPSNAATVAPTNVSAAPSPLLHQVALPVRTAFSPSFAQSGTSILFHTERNTRSALMRAQLSETGEVRAVESLLDDGSRNFHARPSPDGQLLAFDSDREGERGVYVARADGTEIRKISGPGYAAVPTWSPDGRKLAFITAAPSRPKVWNLAVIDLGSGVITPVSRHRVGQVWAGAWFPDGRRICYSHEKELLVADVESGKVTHYPSPRSGRLARTPAVSPDGTRVAFQVYRDGVWLLDLQDQSMRRILTDPTAEEFEWSPDGRRLVFHSRRGGAWGVWMMTVS